MSSSLSMPATGAIIQSVSQTRGAIGYVGLAYVSPRIKTLPYLTTTSTLLLPPWKTPSIKLIPSYARYIIITIRKAPAL